MLQTKCISHTQKKVLLLVTIFFLANISLVSAQKPMSDKDKALFNTVKFDQKLDQQLPLDLEFRNEHGQWIQLSEYFGEKPVILVMAYYECPMLCTLVLNGLLNSLKEVDFTVGQEFNVVVVSIDPEETAKMALEKKDAYLTFYGRPEAEQGWYHLTGKEEAIKQLADTIGFHYVYDARIDEYAHPSGIIITTPQGRTARYFYGIQFPPEDVRFGLVEASEGKIGSPIDQVLLMCYHYDPDTGRYSLLVTNVMRLMATATIILLAVPIAYFFYQERQNKKRETFSEV